jgi:hypothetical protein
MVLLRTVFANLLAARAIFLCVQNAMEIRETHLIQTAFVIKVIIK